MVIEQGDLWWAELPEPTGSEPGYRRPLLVIQSNTFNWSRIRTVVCVVMTSNLQLANAPGNILLKSKQTGLPKDSVANVSQIVTLNKTNLRERIGKLPDHLLSDVLQGVELVLARD